MRNLKKILALVLALVMSMSLLATANASFSDKDKIDPTYAEAVEVLNGLNVFKGRPDGNFDPKAGITRAEVAAIIYRIVTGDVTDKQVALYADYNKFADVKSGSWYAGYVNFCANGEYIKGYPNGTFGPNEAVTGYQALAMILRAVGYDKNGEFTGKEWQVQTAAVAKSLGITNNIIPGTLNTAATRETVAEILFRAILVPTVEYTPAFGYQPTKDTLGWKAFKLEQIEGVVVANEYADLYDDDTLAEGKTELETKDGTRVLNYATELTDIGEARYAYVSGKTVYAMADAGNKVLETGEAVANVKKAAAAEGISINEDTEFFVNFGRNDEGKYETDIRIVYSTDGNAPTKDTTIAAGKTLTQKQYDEIKGIFENDDYASGWVLVGTKYTTVEDAKKDDVSNDMTFKKFVKEYLTTTNISTTEFNSNDNGNWLKVIDNNDDGKADIALQTIFTATQVTDISKKGVVTLATVDEKLDAADKVNEMDEDITVVTKDELAEDSVVIYAVIDGNAQTALAEVVTAEIDKVNRNKLVATTTDGAEYEQSDVCNHTFNELFEDGVKNLSGKTSYDLYLDAFGNLVVFTQTATSGDFALLTDGYFQSERKNDIYGAMVWNGEELVDTDITENGDLFIYNNRDDNDWGNLKVFGELNDNGKLHTTVASLNDKGELLPVGKVFNKKTVDMIDLNGKIADRDGEIGIRYESNLKGDAYTETSRVDKAEVRALASTVYYFVYPGAHGGKDAVVREYVGYKNVPELTAEDKAQIQDSYAVATKTERASDGVYYTANVVVVEFAKAYKANAEVVFVYDSPEVGKNVRIETVDVIRADGTKGSVDVDLNDSQIYTNWREYDPAYGKIVIPGLYFLWETDEDGVYALERMTADEIADSNFALGTVRTSASTSTDDWAEISTEAWNADSDEVVKTGKNPEFQNVKDSKYYKLGYSDWKMDETKYLDYKADLEGDLTVKEGLAETVKEYKQVFDNRVLVAYNEDEEIIYAISFANLEKKDEGNMAQAIYALMLPEIKAEAPSAYEKAVAQAEAALKADPKVKKDLEAAKTALEALDEDKLTVDQYKKVQKLLSDIEAALNNNPMTDLDQKKAALCDELNAFAAPLKKEIAKDEPSAVGVYAKTWLEQYKNSDNTGYTVGTVLNAELDKIEAANDADAAATAMLNGKIAVRSEVVGAATNNLVRLVGGQNTGTGTDFEGNTWNAQIDKAFDKFLADVNTAVPMEDWSNGKALTNVIDAYDTAFAAIQAEIRLIVAEKVEKAIGNSSDKATWNEFVAAVEAAIDRVAGVSDGAVTSSAPASMAVGSNITVTYSYTYNGETDTGSTTVTIVSTSVTP